MWASFESRGPKAPGGDTLAGRAELVGRGRKPTSCGAAWDGGVENENEKNGNVLFGK
jgi:hypothetical protein